MQTERARNEMVRSQVAGRGVRDPAVLAAMRVVPRELFVGEAQRRAAYDDRALPIAAGQTISQPFIVGLMVEALALRPGDRVLEVGSGSGYAAAVMAEMGATVRGIERHGELAAESRRALDAAGYAVEIREGDGTRGWPEEAPFDAILVSAGGPRVGESLLDQLADGGRLVMPVGSARRSQELVRVTRRGETLDRLSLGEVRFVPLIGEQGWSP